MRGLEGRGGDEIWGRLGVGVVAASMRGVGEVLERLGAVVEEGEGMVGFEEGGGIWGVISIEGSGDCRAFGEEGKVSAAIAFSSISDRFVVVNCSE